MWKSQIQKRRTQKSEHWKSEHGKGKHGKGKKAMLNWLNSQHYFKISTQVYRVSKSSHYIDSNHTGQLSSSKYHLFLVLVMRLWLYSGKTFAFLPWHLGSSFRIVNLDTRAVERQGCNLGMQMMDGCSLELCVVALSLVSSGIAPQKLTWLNYMTL